MARAKSTAKHAAARGTTDESIGRPGTWREGRYQQRGADLEQSVNKPSETGAEPHDLVGTQTAPATGRRNASKKPRVRGNPTLTRKDYGG